MLTPTVLLTILSALGLLGGIGLGIKAVLERKALNATASATRAKAGNDEATAASIVAAAARELIDPLRQELATERRENAVDVERERAKVRKLHKELDKATHDLAALRFTMRKVMDEVDAAQLVIIQQDEKILALEQEIARYKEARLLNEDGGFASGAPGV